MYACEKAEDESVRVEIVSILLSPGSLNYQTSILNKSKHVFNYLLHNAGELIASSLAEDCSGGRLARSSSGATD